jgi:hypothetical protein
MRTNPTIKVRVHVRRVTSREALRLVNNCERLGMSKAWK